MTSKTTKLRISPGLSGNKRAWNLERVQTQDGLAYPLVSSIGWFSTLRAAKAAAAHLARKPIVLPYKIV